MNIKQKVTSAIVLGTMVTAIVAPSTFAATNTVKVTGGGAFSSSKAIVKNNTANVVVQANANIVNTFVGASANTGDNHSSFNTGGTNSITTGAATNTVGVNVTGGSNTNTSPCGCDTNTNDVTVKGGGAFSSSKTVVINSSSNSVYQGNLTVVNTGVWTSANTGGNSSSFNTHGSDTITSGPASNTVGVIVGGSTNSN